MPVTQMCDPKVILADRHLCVTSPQPAWPPKHAKVVTTVDHRLCKVPDKRPHMLSKSLAPVAASWKAHSHLLTFSLLLPLRPTARARVLMHLLNEKNFGSNAYRTNQPLGL